MSLLSDLLALLRPRAFNRTGESQDSATDKIIEKADATLIVPVADGDWAQQRPVSSLTADREFVETPAWVELIESVVANTSVDSAVIADEDDKIWRLDAMAWPVRNAEFVNMAWGESTVATASSITEGASVATAPAASASTAGWVNTMMAVDHLPASTLLMGGAGVAVASRVGHSTSTNVPDTTPPVFVSATTSANGQKIVLTYDSSLSFLPPLASALTVTVDGATRSVSGVAVAGSTLELTLASPATKGQTVKVSYADPSTANDLLAVQDAVGNDAATLTNATVNNPVLLGAPLAWLDGSWTSNPQVTLSVSLPGASAQNVVMELYPNAVPLTVSNWLGYVNSSYFSNLIFHRVIPGFMVQGGGFTSDLSQKTPLYDPVSLETGIPGLSNVTGTLAMARTNVADSGTSQFFINVVDNSANLDYSSASSPGYAVFGKVVSGMSTVNEIAAVPTATSNGMANVPTSAVTIQGVSVSSAGQAYSSSGIIHLGGLESGAQWSYSLDGGSVWVPANASQIDLGTTSGQKSVLVRQIDAAGNISASTPINFTQYVADAAHSILDLSTASDSAGGTAGTDQDNITHNTSLDLTATLASWANQPVWLMDNGKLAANATADASGVLSWHVNGAGVGNHVYSLYDPVHQVRVIPSGGITVSELLVKVI